MKSPFQLRNIKLFICLRVFFNSRFYYPVFTILFLDYGLTIEQFSILNAVWAVTIVIAEVPSGALADVVGRKALLVFTAAAMILEMLVIAFVPLGNGTVIFYAFLVNRIVSGLAEAMVSGADEALAYDTLKDHGLEKQWSRVLDIQLRIQSTGYILVMTIGGLVYDPEAVARLGDLVGIPLSLDQQVTMRFPVYLTLGSAVLALVTALLMQEEERLPGVSFRDAVQQATQLIFKAARWTIATPLVLVIILFGTCFDHIMRMLVTLNSQYYRIIGIPEASYGIIGSLIALIGIFVPRGARYMAENWPPAVNVLVLVIVTLTALLGLPLMVPLLGVIFMILIFMVMMTNSFFMSHYLNQLTESEMRATILSFKGLVFNLAYGGIGLLYAVFFKSSRTGVGDGVENAVFQRSLFWFPVYFLVLLVLLLIISGYLLDKETRHSLFMAPKKNLL